MPKYIDRVKEGRSRISMLLDDDLLEALDGVAEITGVSRSKIIQQLIMEGLDRREFYDDMRKYPEYVKYWLDCMALRPKETFYHEPYWIVEEELSGEVIYEDCCYSDQHDDWIMREKYANSEEYYEMTARREKIGALTDKYRKMFDQIMEDEKKEQEERERRRRILEKGNDKGTK